MRALPVLLLVLSLLPLAAGCARVDRAAYAPVAAMPADAHPAPVMFGLVKMDLPAGESIGLMSRGSRFCGWPHEPVSRNTMRGALDSEMMRAAFEDTLQSLGYDVAGDRAVIFDEDEELMRGEFKVGARITAVQLDACEQEPGVLLWLLTSRSGVEGEMHITVDWTVYDVLGRAVAYRTRTAGYGRRASPNEEGLALLAADAFEMATHNLAGDPGFRDLLVHGRRPAARETPGDPDSRPRTFDPRETVTLPDAPLSRIPFERQAEAARAATVMIQTAGGHGSGFFITPQGHILTNDHVAGNARHVRVVLPGRAGALTAEVLRRSDARDTALLRLVEIPAGLAIAPRPVRRDWPAVSEAVFAVGAPVDPYLQNTVSKGIVSAHRRTFARSRRQNMIQSDVEIHAGHSGGPLLDAQGNVVGMAAEGYGGADAGIGLNLFIPIAEALESLDIIVAGDAPAGAPLPLMIQN